MNFKDLTSKELNVCLRVARDGIDEKKVKLNSTQKEYIEYLKKEIDDYKKAGREDLVKAMCIDYDN